MNQTSAPIGSTGQSLEGVAVNTPAGNDLFRESVVITDPTDPDAYVAIVSTQPIGMYGVPVWMQGTPSVSIAGLLPALGGTSQVFGAVSSQIVSSIPIYVSQSSAPWTMNGAVAVTSNVTIQGTSSVNVLNTLTANVTNVPAVNITSSIPFYVNQSSAPWTVNISTMPGLSGTTMVNVVSSVPQTVNVTVVANQITSSIPFFVAQSSAPWSIIGAVSVSSQAAVSSSWPLSTTMVNVVSSIPFFVAQSSSPWKVVEDATTSSAMSATSVVILASLNTTVVKAGPGNLYGYQISNFASTSLFVKFANASSAVVASTARFLKRVGVAPSTSVFGGLDIGVNFSTGITVFTTRNAWDQDLTAPLGSTAVMNILWA